MAVHKVIRSNSPAQPKPQPAKTGRAGGPVPQPQRPNHQFKAEILEVLRHLNRGYGVALAALDKLEIKDRPQTNARSQPENRPHSRDGVRIFTGVCLGEYRRRTESLQAEANRDLLRLMATYEDQQAGHVARPANPANYRS